MPRPVSSLVDDLQRRGSGVGRVPDHEPPEAAVADAKRVLVACIDRRQRPSLRELGPDCVDAGKERDPPNTPAFRRGLSGAVPGRLSPELGKRRSGMAHTYYNLLSAGKSHVITSELNVVATRRMLAKLAVGGGRVTSLHDLR